jgi:hypothetical protein
MEHVESFHTLVSAEDVGCGVAFGVAYVEAGSAGVWEHVQNVEFLLFERVFGLECLVPLPKLLPFRLYDFEIVSFLHNSEPPEFIVGAL